MKHGELIKKQQVLEMQRIRIEDLVNSFACVVILTIQNLADRVKYAIRHDGIYYVAYRDVGVRTMQQQRSGVPRSGSFYD
jgi:hypothetical protein